MESGAPPKHYVQIPPAGSSLSWVGPSGVTMKKKLKDALHNFKIHAFKMSHQTVDQQKEIVDEVLAHTHEALENAYHFHFQDGTSANPQRVETFQLIKSVVLETILPPVVEKMMHRITVLEHTNKSMIKLLDELMEALSEG
jgi:hypothetical protein